MYRKIIVVSTLISGCAPLQQAPLVYTSKQVFGVDFSTPSAESPSVAFNVGYKNLDAVYIPIAVSKKSEKADDIAITEIYATHGKGRSKDAPALEAAPEKLQATENLEKANQTKIHAIEKLESLKVDLENYNTVVETKSKNSTMQELIPNSLKVLLKTSEVPTKLVDKINNLLPLDKADLAIAKAPLEKKVAKAEVSAEQARQEYERAFSEVKRDSMSVFGTFDSSFGNKQESGISNQLGKVFSTGVAAQNLTSGFQTPLVIEKCTTLMNLAINAAQKQQILDICTAQLSESIAKK